MLYNSGKDLESTNSKMVMGFFMSDDDDLCVISEKASFPVREGKENEIGCETLFARIHEEIMRGGGTE